jgi:hypothetical protein
MKRSSWAGALLAVAASAGVAWGQPAATTVTIQQKDGLPEPCSIVKTWKTADGRPAFLMRSLDTDEMLTVVQRGGAKGDPKLGVSIYRWGNASVPPDGSPAPPADSGIRQASFTTEAPHRLGDLPRVAAADTSCAAPAPAAAHAASCPAGGCDKGGCAYVHHYEKPSTITFKPGDCLPVCAPTHAPNYGYYPTQWRPFPGAAEELPAAVPVPDR